MRVSDKNSSFIKQGIPWIIRKVINYADQELQYVKLLPPTHNNAKEAHDGDDGHSELLSEQESDDEGGDNSKSPGPVVLDVPPRFSFKQTVRPGGFDTKNEYVFDGKERVDTVPIFGEIKMHCSYVGLAELEQFRESGLLPAEAEIETPAGAVRGQQVGASEDSRSDSDSEQKKNVAIVEVVSNDGWGWSATTIWGFERVVEEAGVAEGGDGVNGVENGESDSEDEKKVPVKEVGGRRRRRLVKYNTTARGEDVAKARLVYDYLGEPIV